MHQLQREMFQYSKAMMLQSMRADGLRASWPTVPIVKAEAETDPWRIWNMASRVDWDGPTYWTPPTERHGVVLGLEHDTGQRGNYWRFASPQDRGQILFVPDPNIVVVFDINYRDTALIWVEFGCAHEFTPIRRSNCYQEDRCDKCGYHYAVDSSD